MQGAIGGGQRAHCAAQKILKAKADATYEKLNMRIEQRHGGVHGCRRTAGLGESPGGSRLRPEGAPKRKNKNKENDRCPRPGRQAGGRPGGGGRHGLAGQCWRLRAEGWGQLVVEAPARPGKAESGEATGWIRRGAGEALGGCKTAEHKQARARGTGRWGAVVWPVARPLSTPGSAVDVLLSYGPVGGVVLEVHTRMQQRGTVGAGRELDRLGRGPDKADGGGAQVTGSSVAQERGRLGAAGRTIGDVVEGVWEGGGRGRASVEGGRGGAAH